MAKIYSDAIDKNVERIIVFVESDLEPVVSVMGTDAILCYKDSECTQPITNAELHDYFLKGMAISRSGAFPGGGFSYKYLLCTHANVLKVNDDMDTEQTLTLVDFEDDLYIVGCDLDAFHPTEAGPEISN